MYYIIIENIKTKDVTTLGVFSPIEIGTVIEWGSDDGETTAKWKVTYCKAA